MQTIPSNNTNALSRWQKKLKYRRLRKKVAKLNTDHIVLSKSERVLIKKKLIEKEERELRVVLIIATVTSIILLFIIFEFGRYFTERIFG